MGGDLWSANILSLAAVRYYLNVFGITWAELMNERLNVVGMTTQEFIIKP